MATTTVIDYQDNNKTIYGLKSDAVRYTWSGYFLFVLASSIVGDSTILIASIKYRAFKLHNVIVVIIQHMAFCDLMVSITYALPNFVSVIADGWVFGKFLCYLTTYTTYYFNPNSVLLLCTMTTSKLLLLKYPLQFGTTSAKKAHIFCAACWLVALIVPVTLLSASILHGEEIYFSYKTYYCLSGFSSDIWHWLSPLLAVVFMFIPNCVVIATTIYLLIIAKQVAHRGRENLKWQGIMTALLTATVYCISVLPYTVYVVGKSVFDLDDNSSSFFHTSFRRIAISILYLNTISNFYIYSLSVQGFRDFIRSKVLRTKKIFIRLETSASDHGNVLGNLF